jgi:hypothetical protein
MLTPEQPEKKIEIFPALMRQGVRNEAMLDVLIDGMTHLLADKFGRSYEEQREKVDEAIKESEEAIITGMEKNGE